MMKKILAASLLMGATWGAWAQGYAGALIGMSHFKISDKFGCTDCDESGTAGKVYVGGNIAPHAAVELAYVDFGHASGTLTGFDVSSGTLFPLDAKLRSNAFILAGVGKWEVYPKLNVAGKAGFALVRTSIAFPSVGIEERTSRVHPYGGLAIDYEVLKDFRVVGHYDLTKYEVEGEKGTLYQVGLGIQTDF